MSDLDVLRQDFSGILLRRANDRRRSLCGGAATGEDLKIIALFERLAHDAETLDSGVFARCLGDRRAKRDTPGFALRHEALLAQVGILYWPKDAADLLGWIGAQSAEDLDLDRAPGRSARHPIARPRMAPRRSVARSHPTPEEQKLLHGWASDFSVGIGIVAPMLSLWNIRAAFDQMRDRSFVAAHTSVPATVVSVDPVGVGRAAGSATAVVITFATPAGESCRVTWHAALAPAWGAAGESVPVVPRSSNCEMPLIPAQIGDPAQTLALAAALMAAGLAGLKLWAWLFRHAPRPAARPRWLVAEKRRHDLA